MLTEFPMFHKGDRGHLFFLISSSLPSSAWRRGLAVVAVAAIVLENGGRLPNASHLLTMLGNKALIKSERPSHLHVFRQNRTWF